MIFKVPSNPNHSMILWFVTRHLHETELCRFLENQDVAPFLHTGLYVQGHVYQLVNMVTKLDLLRVTFAQAFRSVISRLPHT